MLNQSSIVLYGAYGLPYKPLDIINYKYPDGLSGSIKLLPIAAGIVGRWAVDALFGGNNGTGDKVSGLSKDYVWLVLGLSEGEIEGIVDARGNTSETLDNLNNPYRPLQGVYIDKTPIQNPNGSFNLREENDDGSLKPSTAIDFKYARGDVSENLSLADSRNITAISSDTNSQEIMYELDVLDQFIILNINPLGSRRYTRVNEDNYIENPRIDVSINQAPPGYTLADVVGSEVELRLVPLRYTKGNFSDADYYYQRLDLDYEYFAKATISEISNNSVAVLGNTGKYGICDIDPQSATVRKQIPVATTGYRREFILNNTIDSLKVKISLVLQKTDKQGSPLRERMRFNISIQEQMIEGGPLSPEVVIHSRDITARYPTETFFDYTIPVNRAAYKAIVIIRRLEPPQRQEDGGPGGRKLTLVSITSQTSDRIAYLNTAIAHLQFPAKVLQSSPQIWAKIAGIKIEIPANAYVDYPDGDRGLIFNGSWDGSFYTPSRACADPAWIVWHLLTEPRYNVGIETRYIDKYKLYEISQYNNQLIGNGTGGVERRHLFHGLLGSGGSTNVIEMIRSVCASMNVKPYWNGSMLSFWQDKKEPFGALPKILSNADVEDGKFSYTSQEYQNTTTVAKVSYQSIPDNWDNSEEIVEDVRYISRYGYHTEEFSLLGETRRSAAIRAGRKIIADSLPTNLQVSMVVRPHALFFNPGDVIQIADSAKLKIRHAGLIKSVQTSSIIVPDYPVSLLSDSANCKLLLLLPDGSRVERDFACVMGDNLCTAFELIEPLSVFPNVGATWMIVDQLIPVQKYRIISVEPDGDAQMMFKVVGNTYDENKYAYIENNLSIPDLRPVPKLPAFMNPIDIGVSVNILSSSFATNASQTVVTLVVDADKISRFYPGQTIRVRDHSIHQVNRENLIITSVSVDNHSISYLIDTPLSNLSSGGNTGFVQLVKAKLELISIGAAINPNQFDSPLGTNSVLNQSILRSQETLFSLVANWSPWEPPDNAPASYFSHYIVEYRTQPDSDWTGQIITTEPRATWNNLGFSPFYSVRVATVSINGKTSEFVEFGSDVNNRMSETALLASRQLTTIENSLYSTQDGVVSKANNLENTLYGQPGNSDINSQESIIIQVVLATLGRAATTNDINQLIGFTIGFDDSLLWYQQRQVYYNVANAIAGLMGTDVYNQEFTFRYSSKSTSQILELIYNAAFNRNPDPTGLSAWSNHYEVTLGNQISNIGSLVVDIIFAAGGNTDGSVFRNKVSSLGLGVYRALVVIELFIIIVNSPPTISQLDLYTSLDGNFTYNTVSTTLLSSDISTLTGTNRGIVQQIYNRAFKREPDEGGWSYWEFRLNSGVLVADLIVDIIAAASGNGDGQTLKASALAILNNLGFAGRSGGIIQRVELAEDYLLGNYNSDFESPENLRGLRNGEQGAIAALFGTSSSNVVDKNGVSRTVYSPVSPNSLIVGDASVGEITNNYGGIIQTIYGQFTQGNGFTSSVLATLVGNTSNSVYGVVPNSPSVGNVAIAYGGVIGAIYSTSFDANKATTGILSRLDSIDAKLIELETMITETIRGLELQVAELNEIIEEKNQQLAGLASQVNSLSSSLSSTQTALANALQTIEQLQNPPEPDPEP